MDKPALEAQRERLRKELSDLLETTQRIEREMEQVDRKNGSAHRSLKPRSGEYIISGQSGFMAVYQHTDGHRYTIQVFQRDK